MVVRRGPCLDKNQLAPPRYLYQQLPFLLLAHIPEVRRTIIINSVQYIHNWYGGVNIGLNINCADHHIVTLPKIIFVCSENFLHRRS